MFQRICKGRECPKGFGRVWNGLKGFERILGVSRRLWGVLEGLRETGRVLDSSGES